jgi:PAS domain S-box-containing protein
MQDAKKSKRELIEELESYRQKIQVFETEIQPVNTAMAPENEELTLRERVNKLETIFESVPDPIILTDLNGVVKEINQSTLDLFLYESKSDGVGKSAFDFITKEDRQRAKLNFSKVIKDHVRRNTVYKLIKSNNEIFLGEISTRLMFNTAQEPHAFVIIIKDVTTRENALLSLKQSEESLRNVVDHSSNLFYSHTPDHVLTYLSPQTQEFFDCEPEEAMVHWTELATDNPINELGYGHTQRAIDTGEAQPPFELELIGRTGKRIWVEVYEKPIVEDGKTVSIVGALVDITERKSAQEELKESEIRFQSLSDSTFEAIFISDKGVCIDQNLSAEKMFGYSRREAIGRMGTDWISETDRDIVIKNMMSGFEGAYEATAIRKNETTFPCEIQARMVQYQGNTVRITALRDISHRKSIEDALRNSEENYRLLIENQSDLVVKVDIDGKFEFVSPSYCNLFGKSEDELLGNNFMPLVYEDDRKATTKAMESLYSPPYTAHMEQRAKTRFGWRWLAWADTAILDDDNKVIGIIGVGRDITDRRNAEQALIESERKYKNLFVSSPIGIFYYNIHGVIIDCNSKFVDIIGSNINVLIGMNMYERLNDTALLEQISKSLNIGESYYEDIYEAVTSDKTTPVRGIFKGIRDENDKIIAGMGLIEDITEQRILEDQLRQAQKIESIGYLAGGIAHDFNNLLTPIFGNTEMALLRMKETDPNYVELNEILETADRARELVRQLLAFGRKQIMKFKIVDINELIKNIKGLLRSSIREDIEIIYSLADEACMLRVDTSQIEQVLMNLCVNAQDAMPDGGKISIKTSVHLLKIRANDPLSSYESGKWVNISVIDTGTGIDKEAQSKIFDPFFTTKEVGKGTGLGLSTVYGIIKQHGGEINLKSSNRKGSSFKIELPLVKGGADDNNGHKRAPKYSSGSEVVLIIEDDQAVRRMAVKILKQHGYTVYDADGYDDAVKVMKTNSTNIELLLLDVIMPKVNGVKVYEKLKKEFGEKKVLFMSGYPQEVVKQQGILKEETEYIQKPFSVESLLAQVRVALDS